MNLVERELRRRLKSKLEMWPFAVFGEENIYELAIKYNEQDKLMTVDKEVIENRLQVDFKSALDTFDFHNVQYTLKDNGVINFVGIDCVHRAYEIIIDMMTKHFMIWKIQK